MDDFVSELAKDPVEQLIQEKAAHPAFKWMGVKRIRHEYWVMDDWCKNNKKLPTGKRFSNWLKKIPAPIVTASEKPKTESPYKPYFEKPPEPMSEEQRLRNLEEIRKLKATMQQLGKQWDMNEAIK